MALSAWYHVAFTFDAYTDSLVASPYRAALRRISSVKARDPQTAVFRFRERYPEMFYDAVYHMRILPLHLLRGVPREKCRRKSRASDTLARAGRRRSLIPMHGAGGRRRMPTMQRHHCRGG